MVAMLLAPQRFLKVISTDNDATIQINSPRGAEMTGRLAVIGDYAETMLVAQQAEDARKSKICAQSPLPPACLCASCPYPLGTSDGLGGCRFAATGMLLLDNLADGYAWTRTGASNELTLDRIARGDGSSVSVAMGAVDVVAMNANDFRDIREGDRIFINVGSCVNGIATECVFGETESREVVSIDLLAGSTGTLTRAPW